MRKTTPQVIKNYLSDITHTKKSNSLTTSIFISVIIKIFLYDCKSRCLKEEIRYFRIFIQYETQIWDLSMNERYNRMEN